MKKTASKKNIAMYIITFLLLLNLLLNYIDRLPVLNFINSFALFIISVYVLTLTSD